MKVEKKDLDRVYGNLEQVRAIETLEYHNRNHLAFDIPKRAVHRIDLLTEAIEIMHKYCERQTWT